MFCVIFEIIYVFRNQRGHPYQLLPRQVSLLPSLPQLVFLLKTDKYHYFEQKF